MSKFHTVFLLATGILLRSLAAASVTTLLTPDEISLGNFAQLQISVEGTTNVVIPPSVSVDGLEMHMTGRQVQTQFDSTGRMTASGLYSYTIIPVREGTFDIPAIEINVDGHKETTTPQKLVVTTGTAPARPNMSQQPGAQGGTTQVPPTPNTKGLLAFAKLTIPKKDVYVGEVIPVEAQFYFANDDRYSRGQVDFEPLSDAQVSGEGFTAQKLVPNTDDSVEVVGNIRYRVRTFKTAISAVKSGEMQTPVASYNVALRIPTDEGGGIFGGMIGFAETRNVELKSDPGPIHVKALPARGRPANFNGAVGDFTIAATAQPERVAAGDPITLKVAISGRGNFDTISDPKLSDADGWRLYPPTSRFEKSDDVGYGGVKTFDFPMVAQQPQRKTPIVEFSYFDPDKAKYFTIQSLPVKIEAAAVAQEAQTAVASSSTPQPTATPAPEAGGSWLAHEKKRSWQPVLKQPIFWTLNAAAALVLAGLIVAKLVRRRREGPEGRRSSVSRERDRLVSELRRPGLADDAFCAKALEALMLQARLVEEGGAFEFVRSLETRGRNVDDLYALLRRTDEIKFSGGSLATGLDSAERNRIVIALREACR